jgi:hypothetical protein
MRSLVSALLCATAGLVLAPFGLAATLTYQVSGNASGAWPAIFSSIGLLPGKDGVVVASADDPAWVKRVESGTILIVQGNSPAASSFGFRATEKRVIVRSAEDLRAPKLDIVWEPAEDLPVFENPPVFENRTDARVFMRERHTGAPLMAGFRRGYGAVLWIAASPGQRGYERFPYLPQALADLGLVTSFRSQNLWAFFDSSYRLHVDIDYFAPKWRAAGISALHVAAWHYWERDPQADQYLRQLIDACHRNGILVYAWFELPHVSDKFWDQHPEWREKTALLQDAQLDWRKLMNLTNRDALRTVSLGVADLASHFDWDGINLAELYFESLEGYDNPARFTPMNDDVRAEFRTQAGFDPRDLFDPASPRRLTVNTAGLKRFLDFRADLAARQQAEWIAQAEQFRKTKPYLDLALTHVDDRFDSSMRDKIGADVSRTLPLLASHDFTFLIEDPATIWNLGPQRYPQIAARYQPLTPRQEQLAIDINVVERYQDVYPTKQQTGVELFQLVHQAALSFARVALYFEHSILPADWPLLSASASTVERVEQTGSRLTLQSRHGAGVAWQGPALVDGKLWPVADSSTVWLPAGTHSIQPAPELPPIHIESFNGELKSAEATSSRVEFAYQSPARALALLDRLPARVEIDGAVVTQPQFAGMALLLPRGQHLVALTPNVTLVPTPTPNK